MALSHTHPGALPRIFRRSRVLLVGCGEVGQRVAALRTPAAVKAYALSSSPGRHPDLRKQGLTVISGDLDDLATLYRLAGVAHRVVHLAPPPTQGWEDSRTRHLLQALIKRSPPTQLVYASTTGVYGDQGGALCTEASPATPLTPRAKRRADAEQRVRHFGRSGTCRCTILRIPGIYSPDRSGVQVRERLMKQTPVLMREHDVYTNHIHTNDLARACWLALWKGRAQRTLNVCDDSQMLMGDYYDMLADLAGLGRPPRISRSTAAAALPLQLLSFMGESRRLSNQRLKTELGLRLHYPTVQEGWAPLTLF